MRIAIGVHGRFSAFNIATGLIELGEDVRLYTNYPAAIVERFGVPAARVTSFIAHGLLTRVTGRLPRPMQTQALEAMLHRSFGSWFAKRLDDARDDVAYCWSGVAEEAFTKTSARKVLNRSSVHIQAQRELLAEESDRVGVSIDMPSQWRIGREMREYALADAILVPSEFAARSFDGRPDSSKVSVVPLTARSELWRPPSSILQERARRIRAGGPLRVLFVGAVSYQKGIFDLARVVRVLSGTAEFRFTGAITRECRELVADIESLARFDGHVAEAQLRDSYAWTDVLVCPSIQDGFAVVLAHAQAAGVPFIASTNTGGPELLAGGGKGWIVPIRAADAITERLVWCNDNREALAAMVEDLDRQPLMRSWTDVAREVSAHLAGRPVRS